jgi:ribosomal protein S18 acetylase RimI-like enzyme
MENSKMSTDKDKRRKRTAFPTDPIIAKREVITDQSDPRMIKFREEQDEYKPGYLRKTVKLEITEYEAGPDEMKLETIIGFYEGKPPPEYAAFFRDLLQKAMLKVKEEQVRERWAHDQHIKIRDYAKEDRKSVLQLWKECELTHPREEPAKDISRRLKAGPDLLLVGSIDDKVVATCMGRCDGNRGWVDYLCVSPSFQRKGTARQLLNATEDRLRKQGCLEINLLIDPENSAAIEFSQRAGYQSMKATLMVKSLGDR